MEKKYQVAGHVFTVAIKEEDFMGQEGLMKAYQPFEIEKGEPLFALDVETVDEILVPAHFVEEARQEEEGQVIISGHLADGSKVIVYQWGEEKAVLRSSSQYENAALTTTSHRLQHAIDNSLMLLFAFATAPASTLLFHSSTVVWHDRAYMFLGVSGTGKSTHTRLWLKNIEDTHLLNDDNPVVRVNEQGIPIVYGSPWSGKTSCYKNEQYPLSAIVKLCQYPENQIQQLSVIESYVALTESVSGKRWEKRIADGLNTTIGKMLEATSVFLLRCLPDDEAAKLCWQTVTAQEGGRV